MIEIDYDEVVAFNEAVADMHEACDRAREIRDACECGELELGDAEGRELDKMVREKVETVERWQTALRLKPMSLPAPAEPKPTAQPRPTVAYARVGPLGIVSYAAAPNATFGNTSLRAGDWAGR